MSSLYLPINPSEEDNMWLENGCWSITDQSSSEKFLHIISTSSVRPATIIITGSNWDDGDLLNCIMQVSKIYCHVNFRLEDAFEKSVETTNVWISTLFSKHAL